MAGSREPAVIGVRLDNGTPRSDVGLFPSRPGRRAAVEALMSRTKPALALAGALALSGLSVGWAEAQERAGRARDVHARLVHSVTLVPVPGATVIVEETRAEATTGSDGTVILRGLAPGDYHLITAAPGFVTSRTPVTVTPGVADLGDIPIDPELHYSEVVSVSPTPRDPFESYQPIEVLAGQDLAKELGLTLGDTISDGAGIAERSFGPGPSRPVIRGLDGDRVLILEDGQRMGDLSSQSADHGVNVNPAAAEKIEVVRGPATLLYGANAIGGLVNVISESIPTQRVSGASGTVTVDAGTGANEGGAAGDVLWGNNRWAFRASGSARGSGDVETPDGPVDNSQTRSAYAAAGLSWTGEKSYVGANYAWDDSRFGVPLIEEGQVESTPRRQAVNLRAGGTGLDGVLEGYRASFGYRHYRHDEVVAGEVETAFENNTAEFDLRLNHRAVGRVKGTWGAWVYDRAFSIDGEEALSPPVDQQAVAAFAYEELKWPHVTWQLGGRFDWTRYQPERDLPERDFANLSASTGLLWEPHAMQGNITLAASLAFASRNPALEELYYTGPHPGNFAYEIGNPALESERAIGVDLSLRWRYSRLTGEVTYFRNAINDYIFRQPTGEVEDGFPVVEYVQADSVLQGVEAHTDVILTPSFIAEVALDYVRGELSDQGDPLPRMPPMRFRGGLRYLWKAFQAGGEVALVADQDRVYGYEQPTEGYELLKLYGAYSFVTGAVTNTITARLDNATDERYYNHLSYLKDFVPEMGRNFKVVYSVKF